MKRPGLAEYLDALSPAEARRALERCCGSSRWVRAMVARRPFREDQEVYSAAEEIWKCLDPDDWREAFSHHPRLGERKIEAAPAATREWSRGEQAGVAAAGAETQQALAAGNAEYEERFGHVFLLCATGKSGDEMLRELLRRLNQDAQSELLTAAAEQAKITQIRLTKLVDEIPRREP